MPVGEDAVDSRGAVADVLRVRALPVAEHDELARRDPVAVVARVRERRVPAAAAPEQPQLPALPDRVRVGVAEAAGHVRADRVDRAPVVDRVRRDRHPVAHLALAVARQEVARVRGEEHDQVAVGPEHERRVVVVVAPEPAVDQPLAQLAGLGEARDPHVAGRRDPAGERVAVVRDRARVAEVRPRARAQLTIRHAATLRLAARLGQVLLARLEQDRLALDVVAHRHDALGRPWSACPAQESCTSHLVPRTVAALYCPRVRNEPEPSPHSLRVFGFFLAAARAASARRQRLVERQVGDAAGLRDLEDAVVERRRLGRALAVSSTTPAFVSTVEPSGMPCDASTSTNWLLPGFFTSTLPLTGCTDDRLPGHGRRRRASAWASAVGVGVGCCWLRRRHGEAALHRRPPTARTANVCTPADSPDGEYGDVHAANGAESTLHSNAEPAGRRERERRRAGRRASARCRSSRPARRPREYGVEGTLCGSDVVDALSVHGAAARRVRDVRERDRGPPRPPAIAWPKRGRQVSVVPVAPPQSPTLVAADEDRRRRRTRRRTSCRPGTSAGSRCWRRRRARRSTRR